MPMIVVSVIKNCTVIYGYNTGIGTITVPYTQGFAAGFLLDHFTRHASDFNATSAEEYELLADQFLGSPLNPPVLECYRVGNGDLVRFDPSTNEFGVLAMSRVIRTYYVRRPSTVSSLSYFERQCGK